MENKNQELSINMESPWLQMNGQLTPDKHLKMLTSLWDAETWGKYLNWFENQTGQRAESLVGTRRYDEACEVQKESIFVFAQSSADDELKNNISTYLAKLTQQQAKVIEMIFWEGRSERFVAKSLGISGVAVHQIKKRALKNILHSVKGVSSSRIMRGEISPIKKGGKDEKAHQLAEVDLAKAS